MRRGGFTLVELLVVITIIALLASLLFPVFRSARERARTTVCGSRVKGLLVGLIAYDSENGSLPYGYDSRRTTPPPGGFPGNLMIDPIGWWWFHLTGAVRGGATRDKDLVRCPSKRLKDPMLKGNLLAGNYGVNRALCTNVTASSPYDPAYVGEPLSITNVRRPASALLVVDSGYSLICWWHATAEPPVTLGDHSIEDTAYVPGLEINKDRILWPGQTVDAIAGRHPNKTVNVGYVDGQVVLEKAGALLVEQYDPNAWDYSPLWGSR